MKSCKEAFEMSCMMARCPYSSLSRKDASVTMLFISVSSIINEWYKTIIQNNLIYTPISSAWFTSQILNLVAHYKRYYTTYPSASIDQTYIFLYKGEYEQCNIPQYYTNEIHDMIDVLLPKICKFLPHIYFAHVSDITSSTLPFTILYNAIDRHVKAHHYPVTRALIVSNHFADYGAIALNGIKHEFKIEIIRKRYATVLTNQNLYENCMFKHRKRLNAISIVPFYTIFPLFLIANSERTQLDHIIPYSIKTLAKSHLAILFKVRTINEKFVNYIEEEIYCPYRRYVDMHYAFKFDSDAFSSHYNLWKVDLIDYQIEALNTTIFRNCPIEFVDLF